ncbi:hypothetical protein BD309DRAFT_974073 [Dichomitus squalens]|nr:hypothetical protein BD309DRAFT_974073 [Dichomitus squalens]
MNHYWNGQAAGTSAAVDRTKRPPFQKRGLTCDVKQYVLCMYYCGWIASTGAVSIGICTHVSFPMLRTTMDASLRVC